MLIPAVSYLVVGAVSGAVPFDPDQSENSDDGVTEKTLVVSRNELEEMGNAETIIVIVQPDKIRKLKAGALLIGHGKHTAGVQMHNAVIIKRRYYADGWCSRDCNRQRALFRTA